MPARTGDAYIKGLREQAAEVYIMESAWPT